MRQRISGSALTLLLTCGLCCGNARADWTSEVIQLEPRSGEEQPPVVTALAIAPQGSPIAIAGDDHLVRIWDRQLRRIIATLDGHTDWVRTLAYSPDGKLLVSSGNDRQVIVWDSATGSRLRTYSELTNVVTSVVFNPSGDRVAVVGFGDTLRILNGQDGELLRELPCPCVDMRAASFSPNGEVVVGAGRNGKVRIWNTENGRVLGEFSAHSQRIRDLAISGDGKLIATCGEDRRVVISQINGEESFELPRQQAKVMSLCFLGANELVTGSSDNLIHVWDLNRKERVDSLQGHTGTVAVLAYRDNVLVSTGFDTTVRVWTRTEHVANDDGAAKGRIGARIADEVSRE